MRRAAGLTIVVAFLLSTGCASIREQNSNTQNATDEARPLAAQAPRLKVSTDKFTGRQSVSIAGEVDKLAKTRPRSSVLLGPGYFAGESAGQYQIFVGAVLGSWAFLDGSADLLVDGKQLHLATMTAPSRDVASAYVVTETLLLGIDEDELRLIGQSATVEIRLNGKRDISGYFTARQIAECRKILEAPALLASGAAADSSQAK